MCSADGWRLLVRAPRRRAPGERAGLLGRHMRSSTRYEPAEAAGLTEEWALPQSLRRGACSGLPAVAEPRCELDHVNFEPRLVGSAHRRGADRELGGHVRPDLPLLPRARRQPRLWIREPRLETLQIARPREGDEPVTLAYLDRRPAVGEGHRCRDGGWCVLRTLPPKRSRIAGARLPRA